MTIKQRLYSVCPELHPQIRVGVLPEGFYKAQEAQAEIKGHDVRVRGGIQLQAQPQSFPSPLLQFLHLGARELNGRARVIHSMSELGTPDSSREKKRTLLQFLSDHFRDIQTLREYLLQKQISRVNWQNR